MRIELGTNSNIYSGRTFVSRTDILIQYCQVFCLVLCNKKFFFLELKKYFIFCCKNNDCDICQTQFLNKILLSLTKQTKTRHVESCNIRIPSSYIKKVFCLISLALETYFI